MTIRVVLADDSYIVREDVRELLRGADNIDVVSACSDLDSLVAAIESHHPDVVLTPLDAPIY
jgi:DNA-binding NarL/FixJ family response regulator